jgi:hypothetical protein
MAQAINPKGSLICIPITYSKGRRGRNEAFHPSIHPVIRSIIHPWMASYNNPLQCEGVKGKNSCSLAICQKLKINFKKLKIVEKKLEKQEKNSF